GDRGTAQPRGLRQRLPAERLAGRVRVREQGKLKHDRALVIAHKYRQLAMTVSVTSSSSPVNAILVIARAKPLACWIVALGGMDSTFGSVTTSTSTGPLVASAFSRAGRTWAGSSTRRPVRPTASASAAKLGFFNSTP